MYTYTVTSTADPAKSHTVSGGFGVKHAVLMASIECPGLGHLVTVTRRRGRRGRKEDHGLHSAWQKALPRPRGWAY